MTSELSLSIRSAGGLIATHELHDLGFGRWAIRAALERGDLRRARTGWYCEPSILPDAFRAARVGGRLTCISLARTEGLWVPNRELHVAVPRNACQLRSAADARRRLDDPRVHVHWSDHPDGSRLTVDRLTAIAEVCTCQPAPAAFAIVESALNRGVLTSRAWREVLGSAPARVRRGLAAAAGRSGSGGESLFRFGMLAAGIPHRQQVQIGPDRVDFLVGDRLVIEIDSVEFHDPTVDARRDARLSIRGYRVLRFMYSQVSDDWSTVLASVLAAISRGDHLS